MLAPPEHVDFAVLRIHHVVRADWGLDMIQKGQYAFIIKEMHQRYGKAELKRYHIELA